MQNSFRHFEYYKEAEEIYCRKNPTDDDFLKYMSDKRGTHVDVGHSLVVALINDTDKIGLTPVYYFALQMILSSSSVGCHTNYSVLEFFSFIL